jgi:hypothetical protein
VTEALIGRNKAQPVRPTIATRATNTSPVAPLLPPVHTRIREISGFIASEINRMSRNDNKMGDSNANVWMKTNNAAASNTWKVIERGLDSDGGFGGMVSLCH